MHKRRDVLRAQVQLLHGGDVLLNHTHSEMIMLITMVIGYDDDDDTDDNGDDDNANDNNADDDDELQGKFVSRTCVRTCQRRFVRL